MNTNQRAYCQNDYFFLSSFYLLRLKELFPNINGVLSFMDLDGVRYFYYIDATHMVRGLFNSDGELLVRYSYDAWGNVTNIIDYSSISLSTLNPFLFKCYYYDHESKWYYCLSRYYVPLWMRWLSIDDSSYLTSELPAGYDLYVYCNNNPIMYEDPTGHMPEWAQWIVDGLAFAGLVVATILTCGVAGVGGTAVGAAMLTGGLVSAGINLIDQLRDGGEFNWTELAISTLSGTAYGLVVGLTGGVAAGTWSWGAYAGKLAVAGGTSLLNSWNENKSFKDTTISFGF